MIGATGGLGRAFVEALAAEPGAGTVLALSRRAAPFGDTPRIAAGAIDIEDEASIAAAAGAARAQGSRYHLILVATGLLQDETMSPEKSWTALSADTLARAFRINATGPALVAKHFLPLLDDAAKSVFACLSARVGSIEDNALGGWHAYRASKAALNMMLRTLSIELARRNRAALCVGLHPGTVDTSLSKPFQGNVPDGKLFTPAFSAHKLLGVIDGLETRDSGRLFAWDGQRIPF